MSNARPRRTILTSLFFAAATAVAAGEVSAQPVATPATPAQIAEGRAHFERGVVLFDQGNHDGALIEFQRAWELSRRPSVLFNVAAACQALHRYADAIEALERFIASSAEGRQRRRAQRTLRELRGLVAFVRVSTDPADATLTIDGRAQAANGELIVGPGTHRVEATRAGRNTASAQFTIASGEHRDIRLTLTEAGASTPPPTVVIVDPGRLPPPTPTPTSTSPIEATMEIIDAPPTASVTIDGVSRPREGQLAMRAGAHSVSVTARGMRPWTGYVTVRRGAQHRLTVSLAPGSPGLSPTAFWATTAVTGAFLIATVATGAAALSAHGDYSALPAGSPEIPALASRGRTLSVAADLLGVATLGVGVAAAVLFTRTEFGVGASSARFVLAPLPDGAAASAWVRF